MPTGKLTDVGYDEGAQDYFEGTDWQSHDAKGLRTQDAAMNYFTPAAFRYYLPAYMLAEIISPEEADILGEYVLNQLSDQYIVDVAKSRNRLSQFSGEEKAAILEFIRYMEETYGELDVQFHILNEAFCS
jgi:hypothetical protein